MKNNKVFIDSKYFQKVLTFYSSGFIFSLGCSIVSLIWFLSNLSINETYSDNTLFWITAILVVFCFMFGLGFILLVDELNKEKEK